METRTGRRVSISTQGVGENAVIQLSNVTYLARTRNKDVSKYQEVLKGITFPEMEGGIELLIGADVPGAHRTLKYRMSRSGGPKAVRSAQGWGLVGPVDQCKDNSSLEVSHVNLGQSERLVLNDLMKRMYERDFIGKKDAAELGPSVEDKRALQVMEESVVKENGHYQIALPRKSTSAKLPNNNVRAESRLKYLGRKLEKDPELHQKYRNKMAEYLESGHARKVSHGSLAPGLKTWYVPHHTTRGKFRIVFDCAAKFKGTSLNNHLLQGPDHTSNLIGVLLRFRSRFVAVIADIKECFTRLK